MAADVKYKGQAVGGVLWNIGEGFSEETFELVCRGVPGTPSRGKGGHRSPQCAGCWSGNREWLCEAGGLPF